MSASTVTVNRSKVDVVMGGFNQYEYAPMATQIPPPLATSNSPTL